MEITQLKDSSSKKIVTDGQDPESNKVKVNRDRCKSLPQLEQKRNCS
jgi:hypothetical protein